MQLKMWPIQLAFLHLIAVVCSLPPWLFVILHFSYDCSNWSSSSFSSTISSTQAHNSSCHIQSSSGYYSWHPNYISSSFSPSESKLIFSKHILNVLPNSSSKYPCYYYCCMCDEVVCRSLHFSAFGFLFKTIIATVLSTSTFSSSIFHWDVDSHDYTNSEKKAMKHKIR